MAGKHTCVLSECHSTRVPKKVAENAEWKRVTDSWLGRQEIIKLRQKVWDHFLIFDLYFSTGYAIVYI